MAKGKPSAHVPIRTCVACRAKRSKGELLRLAHDDAGRVVRDEMGRRPGRGAYVCRSGSCLEHLQTNRLERAFRVRRTR